MQSLDDDALLSVLAVLDEAGLCAIASSCRRCMVLASSTEALWVACAGVRGVRTRPTSISWREVVIGLRRAQQAVRPHAVLPPLGTPLGTARRRCAAVSQQQGACSAHPWHQRIQPLSAREKQWLSWYGLYHTSVLHVESCRVGDRPGTALHAHDPSTDACLGCLIYQDAPFKSGRSAPGPVVCQSVTPPSACGGDGTRLSRALDEFRHRASLVGKVSVCDASKESGRRAVALLNALPPALCRRLDSMSIEGCPPDALTALANQLDTACLPPSSQGVAAAAAPATAAPATAAPAAAAAPRLPAVLIVDQWRPKVSIGHAMDIIGSVLAQVARHAEANEATRIHHVVVVAASSRSADTLAKAVRSIGFKSHLVLPPRLPLMSRSSRGCVTVAQFHRSRPR